MAIDRRVIDQLLTDHKQPENIIKENGMLQEVLRRFWNGLSKPR
jgi:hypothetical protein